MRPRAALDGVTRVTDPPDDRSRFLCLDKNERVDPLPARVLRELLDSISADDLSQYPVIEPFRERVATWLGVPSGWIALTAGSDGAIRSFFDAYGQADDTVVLLEPTFAMYGIYARIAGMRTRPLQYDSELRLSAETVVSGLRESTRLLCLPNPNSPTGTAFSLEELREIIGAARAAGAMVLVDEAYFYFHDVTALGLVAEFDNLIVTRTFSKAGGLAGVRLGFAVARPNVIEYLRRVKPMYEISSIARRFGEYLIAREHLLWDYAREANAGRALLARRLADLGFVVFESAANFVVARAPEHVDPGTLQALLRNRHVLIKARFNDPPLEACIRITTASTATMERFLVTFEDVYREVAEHS